MASPSPVPRSSLFDSFNNPGYASLPACPVSLTGPLIEPSTLEAMLTQARFSSFQGGFTIFVFLGVTSWKVSFFTHFFCATDFFGGLCQSTLTIIHLPSNFARCM